MVLLQPYWMEEIPHGLINYYDSDGSLIAENQTHVEDPGYPMDVAVSDNGEIMMVTYQIGRAHV